MRTLKKSIVVRRCERLVQTLYRLGYRNQINTADLRYWIAYTIGGDPKTVERYMKRLGTLGYIKQTSHLNIWEISLNPVARVPVGQKLIVEAEIEEPP